MKEIVIDKEDAVFWMDGNGRWHNQHGEFEHKRVIDYFNRSIGHDTGGYFVSQQRGDVIEKVYFRYEETALFVVEIVPEKNIRLRLNTGEEIRLDPDQLRIKNDALFIQNGAQLVKFNDRAMLKLSHRFEEKDGHYQIRLKGRSHAIPTDD